MKITAIFLILSASLLINSSSTLHSPILVANQNENLANFACKVTKDVVNSEPHTQDILIVNMAGNTHSVMINDITKCIGEGNSVILSDLKAPLIEKNLRKASLIILVMDKLDLVSNISN